MIKDKSSNELEIAILETLEEVKELPDNITALKQMLVKVVAYNKVILNKLDKFMG